jgi:AAA+ superfamily predicted ATPase
MMEAELAGRRSPRDGSSLDDLAVALERLDRLLLAGAARAQAVYGAEAAVDRFRGLHISDGEVQRLLSREPLSPTLYAEGNRSPENTIDQVSDGSRLAWLRQAFDLSAFDMDVILMALAPDLDLRYERLYAYLQDDVTRKRPSVDLCLNLLCPTADAKLQRRAHFAADAPLIRQKLLHLVVDPNHVEPPLLAHYLRLDEQVVDMLLGQASLDRRLASFCQLREPSVDLDSLPLVAEKKTALATIVAKAHAVRQPVRLYFQGPHGAGRRDTAEALARIIGVRLLAADLSRATAGVSFKEALAVLLRAARFQGAMLYVDGIDTLRDERPADYDCFVEALSGDTGIAILAGTGAWRPSGHIATGVLSIPFAPPPVCERRACWEERLAAAGVRLEAGELDVLADRFRLTPVQIADAVATGCVDTQWRAVSSAAAQSDLDNESIFIDLLAAARGQCGHDLTRLARKVEPVYTWDDLVLPDDAMAQLREICQHIQYRQRVFEEWGFGHKLSSGKGVNALFAGPSGTGKTMAAEVIANELGLDLYKIDLAGVVSKYIGETEKNLDHIFCAAENANAILFFDEADALFGKRSEVRDSHDRYANIEISYLLQKMDQYEGIAILATNLRANLDESFTRRLTFTVHFPFPDEADRRRIWAGVWPPEIVLAEGVDFDHLARQFKLSGGNIRNIVLAAAFAAAGDGGSVTMAHLLHGTRREYQKMGKMLTAAELQLSHGYTGSADAEAQMR